MGVGRCVYHVFNISLGVVLACMLVACQAQATAYDVAAREMATALPEPVMLHLNSEGRCQDRELLVIEGWVGRTLDSRDALLNGVSIALNVRQDDRAWQAALNQLEQQYDQLQQQNAPDCALQVHAYLLVMWQTALQALPLIRQGQLSPEMLTIWLDERTTILNGRANDLLERYARLGSQQLSLERR